MTDFLNTAIDFSTFVMFSLAALLAAYFISVDVLRFLVGLGNWWCGQWAIYCPVAISDQPK